MDYGTSYLKPAGGTQVKPLDYQHPFADYLESLGNNIQYRALFTEGRGSATRKVIGRSPGGAAIAMELDGRRRARRSSCRPYRRASAPASAPTSPAAHGHGGAQRAADRRRRRRRRPGSRTSRVPGIDEARERARDGRGALRSCRDRGRRGAQRLPRPRPLPAHPLAGGQVRLRPAGARRPRAARPDDLSRGVDEPASFYYDGELRLPRNRSRAPKPWAWTRTTACASASRSASPRPATGRAASS